MKTIKLEGELVTEVKKQFESIDGMRRTIEDLSTTKTIVEKSMWQFIKKVYPDLSDNCRIEKNETDIIIIDRMAD